MSRRLYTRICTDCGKVMQNVGPNRKRCAECARRFDLTSRREQEKLHRKAESRHEREQRVQERTRSLHADALAAKQAGTSYGKYMLAKNKKPSGVTSTEEPARG